MSTPEVERQKGAHAPLLEVHHEAVRGQLPCWASPGHCGPHLACTPQQHIMQTQQKCP